MTVRKAIQVHGRVQGVSFRYFTAAVARGLDLTGTVANLPDGSVEIFVEGKEDLVRSFVDKVREGPPSSRVERLDVRDEKPSGATDRFEIAYLK